MTQKHDMPPDNKKSPPSFPPPFLCDFLLRLTKSAVVLAVLLSLSLVIFAAFSALLAANPTTTITTTTTNPWFSFSLSSTSSSSSSCRLNQSGPTQINHLLFGLSGSAKTWKDRRRYSGLWWDPNSTRGFVWLDDDPPPEAQLGPENSPQYRVSARPWKRDLTRKASDRMARILKETYELGLPDVRWFVMGDDDTVFFKENLVGVLSRYDESEMYYVGGVSESVEQDVMHGYGTAFGGGGFAVSYPLACELVRILDGCIHRYHHFYGSDEKVSACVAELGVPLTREPGFHQLDIRGDPYGLLAAHPVAPLVSLHHLDHVNPLFPGQTQLDSLGRLIHAYHLDPGLTLQQSFCYDHRRKWSLSISWGYTAQLYPSLISSRVLSTPLQTFRTWRSWSDGPFVFNTRPMKGDPCERPISYYLDQVWEVGEGKTVSTYKRVAAADGKTCNQSAYKYAMSVEKITASAVKTGPEKWMKAPRRQCCEITDSWTVKRNMQVKIRSCKPREAITM